MNTLIHVIDGFVHLLNVSFYSHDLFREMGSDLYSDSNPIIQNSQRLNRNNFTYRVQKPSDTLLSINTHWWIAPKVSLYYIVKN